ncbi:hypothetical protein MXB_2227, partial [Myxobolus squamalis]
NYPLNSLPECIDRFDKIPELEQKFDNYVCSDTFDIRSIAYITKNLTNILGKIDVKNRDHESVKFYIDFTHFHIKYSLLLLKNHPLVFHLGNETINFSPLASLPDILLQLKSFNVNRFEIPSSIFLYQVIIIHNVFRLQSLIILFTCREFINTVNEYRNILDKFLNMDFTIKPKPSIVGIKIKSILNKIVSYTDSYHKHVEIVDKMNATIDEKQRCIVDLTNDISIKVV